VDKAAFLNAIQSYRKERPVFEENKKDYGMHFDWLHSMKLPTNVLEL
jgi:hypothetical protein